MVSIIEALKEKEDGNKLLSDLERIRENAESLLAEIGKTFPEYTIHDIRHSMKVIEKLDMIIPDGLKVEMSEYEIFFLLASAYLHDIGMIDLPELFEEEKFEEFFKKLKAENPEISKEESKRKFIREYHHLRSEEYIIRRWKELGIKDEHQARIIGRICRGHRKENLNNKTLFNPEWAYKDKLINTQLLAALLRIADELDLDFERSPLIVYETLKPKDPISREEWEKNLSISGIAPSREDPLLLRATAICKSPKIHRALKSWESKVQNELYKLPDYLHGYRKFRKDMPARIVVDITPDGYKPFDVKFRLNDRQIIQLFMGERLYGDKYVCIRELLQNAVDACRMRKETIEKSHEGLKFEPKIVFELTPDGKLIVEDNGIGMDEYIVENYLTNVGSCFYESPDFKAEEWSFTPVSKFGIGIMSCFMIADRLGIETKAESSKALFIEVNDMFDYFFVRESERKEVGTKVVLYLRNEVKKEIEEGKFNLLEKIKHWARHLEFPIEVRSQGKKKLVQKIDEINFNEWVQILDWKEDFILRSILSETKKAFPNDTCDRFKIKNGVAIFKVEKEDISGTIGISLTNLNGKWKIESVALLSAGGIFIDRLDNLIPNEVRGVFVDINIRGDLVDLTVARDKIVENEKFHRLKLDVEELVANALEELLKYLLKKYSGKEIPIDRIGSRFDANFFLRQYLHLNNIKSESVKNLLRKYYSFTVFSKSGSFKTTYENGNFELDKTILIRNVHHLVPLCNESVKYLEELIRNCTGFKDGELYLVEPFIKDIVQGNVKTKELLDFFELEKPSKPRFIPKQLRLVEFTNYKTDKIIEAFRQITEIDETYLNAKHKFVNLLLQNKNIKVIRENKTILKEFFQEIRSIDWYGISDKKRERYIEEAIKKQKQILQHLTQNGIITEEEAKEYVLTKDDFPQILFEFSSVKFDMLL